MLYYTHTHTHTPCFFNYQGYFEVSEEKEGGTVERVVVVFACSSFLFLFLSSGVVFVSP